MWLCCPSAFSPDVGPSVLSDEGEPASPSAAAVPTIAKVAIGLNPSCILNGTKMAAIIGIVEKDDPIPIVISRPTSNIATAPMN